MLEQMRRFPCVPGKAPGETEYRLVFTCTECGKTEETIIHSTDNDEAIPVVSEDGLVHGLFVCRDCLPHAA